MLEQQWVEFALSEGWSGSEALRTKLLQVLCYGKHGPWLKPPKDRRLKSSVNTAAYGNLFTIKES